MGCCQETSKRNLGFKGYKPGFTREFEKINAIVAKYGGKREALISILQEVQEEYRYLPEEIQTYIATAMDLTPATVYGVATFYTQFFLEPRGKYVLKVCDGTACHVKGADKIYDSIRQKLGLLGDVSTTKDLRFTVEKVSCLGACGIAPILVVNEDFRGQMTADVASIIIDEIIKAEGEEK